MALGYGRTGTNNFAHPDFIVDTSGLSTGATHTTITAAMSSASAGSVIGVRPGTYTEDFTHKDGVTLLALVGSGYEAQTVIKGKITRSGTGSAAITGFRLETNGDFAVSQTGSGSFTYLTDCYIQCDDNVALDIDAGTMRLQSCYWNQSGTNALWDQDGGILELYHCIGLIATTGASNTDGGTLRIFYSQITNKINITNAANHRLFFVRIPIANECIELTTAGTVECRFCHFNGGSAAAVTVNASCTAELYQCNFACSGSTCATGAGEIILSDVTFDNLGETIDATTITNVGTNQKITKYTSNDTWTKDWRTKSARIIGWGGGGGGGSGARGPTNFDRRGGGGGACQGVFDIFVEGDYLGATETVTIGAGGAGGTAQTSDSSNGNDGTAGGVTSFGDISTYNAGQDSFGSGGTNGASGTGTEGAEGPIILTNHNGIQLTGGGNPNSGGFGTPSAYPNSSTGEGQIGGGGAGAGGGLNTGNTERNGGEGAPVTDWTAAANTLLSGGTAGTAGAGTGGNGNASSTVTSGALFFTGTGGGGGGSEGDGSTPSGQGGNGGIPGGGGGGGGASANGGNSGVGGTGARGELWVIEYFN